MPAAPLPPDEAARLATLRDYAVLDTPREKAFDDAARVASLVCDAPVAFVSLVDADRQWFKAAHNAAATETPRERSFCAHAILEPARVLVVPDATQDPRFADNPDVVGGALYRAYAGAPLLAPDGRALGTLCVLDVVPREFGPGQVEALEALARIVIRELELRRTAIELAALAPTAAKRAPPQGAAPGWGAPGSAGVVRLDVGVDAAVADDPAAGRVAALARRLRLVTLTAGEGEG